MDADVIIVGGGPAGSTLASYLAMRNVDVLLLEKAHHPRRHVGESLVPATTRVFKEIGFLEVMEREGLVAKTELAIYDGRQSTVDLLQDNYVSDPRGELTADRIRVNLTTNKVQAEGNVRGIVYPQAPASASDEPG